MKRMIVIGLLLLFVPLLSAGEGEAVKPPLPGMAGPPPLPFEADVLRYVFEHFPGVNREEVMKFIGDNFKADVPEFRKLSNEDAVKATTFMMDLVGEALVLMDIARKDSELASMMVKQKDLERKARRKAAEVVMADGKDKEVLKAELRKMLEAAFDAKQTLMKRDLAGLQAELRKLDEMILRRSEYRSQIIDRKLNELTMEEHYLKW